MRKPLAILVWDHRNDSSALQQIEEQNALGSFLREDLGYETRLHASLEAFQWEMEKAGPRGTPREPALLAITQPEYGDAHARLLELARERFPAELPVAIFTGQALAERFYPDPGDPWTRAFLEVTDTGFNDLCQHIAANWEPRLNWFGVELPEDQAVLLEELAKTYAWHLPGVEATAWGMAERHHATLAQALRLRLLPPELVKGEFDDALRALAKRVKPTPPVPGPSPYASDEALVRAFAPQERFAFLKTLFGIRGQMLEENGGVTVFRSSCGPNVRGFAIDPLTMETAITQEKGTHHEAEHRLSRRLQIMEGLRRRRDPEELDDEAWTWHHRLVHGLVFLKVDGLRVPVLQLFPQRELAPAERGRIVRYAQANGWIPVNNQGELIEFPSPDPEEPR